MTLRRFLVLAGVLPGVALAAESWPQFRGPNGSGIQDQGNPPVHLDRPAQPLWKTGIPPGLSSPIVWEQQLFLTGVVSNQLVTLAYDAGSGRELWRRASPAAEMEKCHGSSSPAASTPCTDGERVYSYFGSYGLIAYDLAGREIWTHPFARVPTEHGTASSPILAGGQLILQRDGDSTNAQLVALEPSTGRVLWETSRPLARASYSTPMVWRHDGLEELIVQGQGRLTAYPLRGGPARWWVRGWGFAAVTTPVAGDGFLFAGGGSLGDPAEPEDPAWSWTNLLAAHDANQDGKLGLVEVPASLMYHVRKDVPAEVPGVTFPFRDVLSWLDADRDGIISKSEWEADLAYSRDKWNADRFVAIRPGGQGDSTASHVAWETSRGLPEAPSPLFYRGYLYLVRDGGMLTVIEPRSGRRLVDRERMGSGGQQVASPVASNGFVYIVHEPGTITVLRAGLPLEIVAQHRLGESVWSTPAIAGDRIFVRGREHLFAIGR